jgi:phospholipid/cholesterol/gamma-HCH transport system permease protein
MKNFLESVGEYFIFLYSMLTNRESTKTYIKLIIEECAIIGIGSAYIVIIISIFIGGVTTIQLVYNLKSPFLDDAYISFAVRDMIILELAPTFVGIVFAGRIGSSIASELGSMKITEQIDALEIMGINSISYLALPKIVASVIMYPMLVIISIFVAISSGAIAGTYVTNLSMDDYIKGIQLNFNTYNIKFALYKAITFGFIISSLSAYKGFHTQGGALEVGRVSTKAVTGSCIALLIADYLLAQWLLNT